MRVKNCIMVRLLTCPIGLANCRSRVEEYIEHGWDPNLLWYGHRYHIWPERCERRTPKNNWLREDEIYGRFYSVWGWKETQANDIFKNLKSVPKLKTGEKWPEGNSAYCWNKLLLFTYLQIFGINDPNPGTTEVHCDPNKTQIEAGCCDLRQ